MGGEENKPSFMDNVRTNWAAFRIFVWNSEKGEVLGRNAKSWAQITLFYVIYYACLAAFWAGLLYVFLQTVDLEKPTYSSYVSRPGLTNTPKSEDGVIKFSAANNNDYSKYVDQLQAIWDSLDPANQTEEQGYVDCEGTTGPPTGKYCMFNRENLGEYCVPPDFGYDKSKPCIFLSLNRVVDWEPEDYEASEIPKEVADVYETGHIAFKCGSYKNKHPEQIGHNTRMYPSGGVPFYYYPFVGTTNKTKRAMYKHPYVAVRLDLLEKEKDITLQCKTYTASIEPLAGLYTTKFESVIKLIFHLSKEPVNLKL
ncbi:sodium/potassium-transporting ATPase subunit beta-1-like isoform X1 [Asterias rubens]|uniref:sodium/potassium-transporting ATPase subunit beta-1-like isoform X1 n=1 Tax=Asterias rubens TaxID=7604 RepID=UPI00145567B6|nr:sodium/potassium-transporting ATPase subunit beta-1-like isoform X1 [Asterias rubens]